MTEGGRTLYEVLDVEATDSHNDVIGALDRLAAELHPSKNAVKFPRFRGASNTSSLRLDESPVRATHGLGRAWFRSSQRSVLNNGFGGHERERAETIGLVAQ